MRPALRASRPLAGRASCVGRGAPHWKRSLSVCPICLQHDRPTLRARLALREGKPVQLSYRKFSSATKVSDKDTAATAPKTPAPADDPEPLIVGAEEPLSVESEEDAREYERLLRQEEREEFQRQVEGSQDHRDYRPASDWNGLQWLGGEHDWPRPARAPFRGFIPAQRINDPTSILYAVNRAAVEVFAAHSARLPTKRLPIVQPQDLMDSDASLVRIAPSSDGRGAVLTFPNEEVRQRVMLSVKRDEATEPAAEDDGIPGTDPIAQDPAEAEAEARSNEQEGVHEEGTAIQLESEAELRKGIFGDEWSKVPVTNPIMKLAIARRITQLTGHVISDPVMHSATKIGDFASHLRDSVRKPKTLFESLVGKDAVDLEDVEGNVSRNFTGLEFNEKGPLADLANVAVSKDRVTPVDREKAVGRWKAIESELRKRGLPVLGKR